MKLFGFLAEFDPSHQIFLTNMFSPYSNIFGHNYSHTEFLPHLCLRKASKLAFVKSCVFPWTYPSVCISNNFSAYISSKIIQDFWTQKTSSQLIYKYSKHSKLTYRKKIRFVWFFLQKGGGVHPIQKTFEFKHSNHNFCTARPDTKWDKLKYFWNLQTRPILGWDRSLMTRPRWKLSFARLDDMDMVARYISYH